jgi:Protein of unknown function (DUF2892)
LDVPRNPFKRPRGIDANPFEPVRLSAGMEVVQMTNEGTIDRAVRIVLGLGLLSLAFVGPQSPLGYVGLVPLATGLIGFCPLYRLFGFSSCRVPKP